MYSIYITNNVQTIFNVSKILYWKNVEQNPVIPKQNSGAKNIILYLYYEYKLFYFIILLVLKKHDNMQLVLPA